MVRNCIFTLLGFALFGVLFWAASGLGKRRFKDEEDKQEKTPYLVKVGEKIFVDPWPAPLPASELGEAEKHTFLIATTEDQLRQRFPNEYFDPDVLSRVLLQQRDMKGAEGWGGYYHNKRERTTITIDALTNAWSSYKPARHVASTKRITNDSTLIIYNYHQTDLAQVNLEFFLRHHNPNWADLLLVVNGDELKVTLPDWIMVLKRPNFGFEMCSHMTVLPVVLGKSASKLDKTLWNLKLKTKLRRKNYAYFILMNASVRGPFYPTHP